MVELQPGVLTCFLGARVELCPQGLLAVLSPSTENGSGFGNRAVGSCCGRVALSPTPGVLRVKGRFGDRQRERTALDAGRRACDDGDRA